MKLKGILTRYWLVIWLLLGYPSGLLGATHSYAARSNEISYEKNNERVQETIHDKSRDDSYEHKVLFIASYHPGFPTFFEQVDGLRHVFDARGIHFDIEFLDAKRFDVTVAEPLLLDTLTQKLAHLPPYDLVITADDAALVFSTRFRPQLFPDKPIVFFGVNDARVGLNFSDQDNVTGVLEQPSFAETVALYQRLLGNKGELVLITDTSNTGMLDTEQFKVEMQHIDFNRYEIYSLEDQSVEGLVEKASRLRPPSALLLISAYRDRDKQVLMFDEFLANLRGRTRVPIFHLWQHGMGLGIFGGKLISHRVQARLAAEMAASILEGKPVSTLPVIRETSNEWVFDFNELKRFGFEVADMPSGSRIVNQPNTLYERFRAYVSVLLVFVAALFLIIASLIVRIRARKSFEIKLMEMNRQLESKVQQRTMALDKARQEAESLLRVRNVILNNSLVGIVLIKDRHVEWVNSYAEIMFGYASNEVIGKPADFIYANRADFEKLGSESIPVLQRGESYRAEFEFLRKDGSVLWGIINGKALNADDLAEGVLYIIMDISPRKQAEDQLREMNIQLEAQATTDHLTGLSNRRHVSRLIAEEIDRCKRYPQNLSVILLDIDHFKSCNDQFGHDVGDRVLKEIARLLQQTLRNVDTVARWGGEEFLVLCPATTRQDAGKLAELLRIRIELYDFQLSRSVTASFGVASLSADQPPDALIKCADQALYQAKRDRNCVCLFTP